MYLTESEIYKCSEMKDCLTSANVAKAARFLLSLNNHAFEKQSVLQAIKLRAVLKHALQQYLEPLCPSLSRLSWILQLEQEIAILLRLVKSFYPLLTVTARNQLITHLHHSSDIPERTTVDNFELSCAIIPE